MHPLAEGMTQLVSPISGRPDGWMDGWTVEEWFYRQPCFVYDDRVQRLPLRCLFASLWVHNRTLGYVCERQQESEMALYHVSAQTRSEEY